MLSLSQTFTPSIDHLSAKLHARKLHLCRADKEEQQFLLDQPWTALIVDEPQAYAELILALEQAKGTLVLPQDGGLIGNLSVRENFALALRYNHADFGMEDRRHFEHLGERMLEACGLDQADIDSLGNALPLNLTRVQRWLSGFVRAMLLAPELLVLDSLFHGLGRRETEQISSHLQLFPLYHPFRPVLLLEQEAEALPNLPNCRTIVY